MSLKKENSHVGYNVFDDRQKDYSFFKEKEMTFFLNFFFKFWNFLSNHFNVKVIMEKNLNLP